MTTPNETIINNERRSHAARLHELFCGAEDRHLTYDPARLRLVGSKMEMKDENDEGPRDRKDPPTVDLWEKHLAGTYPLGISPLRHDGMCRWGLVDIDVYDDLDHSALANKIQRAALPLIVCRSKSGGAHVFLFVTDWIHQAEMNAALVAIAVRLGYADAEVYPPVPGKKGNCINMPMLGGSERWGVKPRGLDMSVVEFLYYVEKARCSPADVTRLAKTTATTQKPGSSAPSSRVLRNLTEKCDEIAGLTDGRKRALHDTAFLFGKYVLKDRIEPETVISKLIAAGVTAGLEPVAAESHARNGLEGRLRKRGGADGDDGDDENEGRFAEIDRIVMIEGGEEPMWRVTVADYGDITLPSREVWKNDVFNLRCAERLKVGFRRLSVNEWADRINAALSIAETEAAPTEASQHDLFRDALNDFLFDKHRAENMDELLLGKPYPDDEKDKVWFRFKDMYKRLCQGPGTPLQGVSRTKIGEMLRGIGRFGVDCDVHKTTAPICKKTTEVWWVRMGLLNGAMPQLPLPKTDRPPI
ncbi:hypothetical protein [Rhizobium sp. RCC_161_2]|uniref:TOTE conflict system archaeo-eukaryotic primase domain-containing protein n=1 Tax=Rhizobium sp. RCC_161_2 TaxID=3239219 RepID=UPI003526B0ED